MFIEYSGLIPLGLTILISFLSKDYQKSSPVPQFESVNSLEITLLYGSTLMSIHDYWGEKKKKKKSLVWILWTFVGKVIFLFFNMLSRASLVAHMKKNLPAMP